MNYKHTPNTRLHKLISIDRDHAESAGLVFQSEGYLALVIGQVVLVEYNNRTKVIEDIQTASQSVISSVTPFDREAFNRTFNTNH